jgi:hypothetical protein
MHWQSGTYTRSRDPSGLKEARASPPDRLRGQRRPSRGAGSWPLGEPDARAAVNQLPPVFFFFFPTLPRDPATGTRAEISNLVMIRVVRVYVGMCVRGAAAATERPPMLISSKPLQHSSTRCAYSVVQVRNESGRAIENP